MKDIKTNTILEIKDLSFSYGSSTVLDGLDFEIQEGSFVSILGPNGSGKSTLINLISKVLKGYEGCIKISGKDIKNLSSREIAKLAAVVPQYSNPGFDFTVEEMVIMGRFPYVSRFGSEKSEDFDMAESVMEKTKLLGLSKKKFNELSGGEKQRVVIAQALVQNTPIILLDEPTSHLDINFQIEIMDLFYNLNLNEGKTIIGVFHDINLAANYSKTAIFLKEGKIYSFGEIGSTITKENIKNVFKSDVLVGRNPFTGKVYISPSFNQVFEKEQNIHNIRVHVIGGGGAASPILSMLSGMGYGF
ncbi:MAG: ABC transporter ATP-binding protein, partial [Actinobacteria bacterium]|nr:ABC transporter ATP-binding protein [Actinomycetota bacterium]